MKLLSRNVLVLSLGITLGVSLSIGQGVFANRDGTEATLPLDELRNFTQVFSRIKADYVEPVDDKTLLENAIRGMVSGLDPHSSYLDTSDYHDLQVGTTGEFGGLGIEVSMEDGFVKVISPIDDTPAQRAGVAAGDLIIRLDETPVKGLTLRDAVNLMRGEVGTDILLTIVREGEEKPLKITITRDKIKVKSVKFRLVEPNIGYVRITQFQQRTGENLLEALDSLAEENDNALGGMILDLRNNPGGVLSAAVDVSDAFLEKGLIVYTEGRIKNSEMTFNARPGDEIDGAPLIVLVNEGSASASEIVAGALQDHKRALIIGNKTFGKGSVQTILPLGRDSAIKLTTARYFTPAGRSIQAEGIVPDIVLDHIKVSSVNNKPAHSLKEADLSGHLSNGRHLNKKEEDSTASENEEQSHADKRAKLAKQDYQLYEAVNMLKGLMILQR
ncbi:Carboxyl-terminal protease [hydrothermal vent metagenome]|uniref:Carboxyl-terminal protease n=1 Tax=hydrothermal vent metagenome TaxID=652676 RepID=A0A3B0Z973_9ZZZZ